MSFESSCLMPRRGYLGLLLVEKSGKKARYAAVLQNLAEVYDVMVPDSFGEEEWRVTSVLADGREHLAGEMPLIVLHRMAEGFPVALACASSSLSFDFSMVSEGPWPAFIAAKCVFLLDGKRAL